MVARNRRRTAAFPSRHRRNGPPETRRAGGLSSGPSRASISLARASVAVAFEDDVHNLLLHYAPIGSPPLGLVGLAACTSLTAAPIEDHFDVVAPFEQSAQSILEMGVRPADDEQHPAGIVVEPIGDSDDVEEESRRRLRHCGGRRPRRMECRIIWRAGPNSGRPRTRSAPTTADAVSRRVRRVLFLRSRRCWKASASERGSRVVSTIFARSTALRAASTSIGSLPSVRTSWYSRKRSSATSMVEVSRRRSTDVRYATTPASLARRTSSTPA